MLGGSSGVSLDPPMPSFSIISPIAFIEIYFHWQARGCLTSGGCSPPWQILDPPLISYVFRVYIYMNSPLRRGPILSPSYNRTV